MQLTTQQLLNILADLIAVGQAWPPASTYIGLFTAIVDSGAATTMANLTVAPGTLAAPRQVGTWSSTYVDNAGDAVADGPEIKYWPQSSSDNCTVLGWYATNASSGGILLGYGYLPSPTALRFGGAPLTIVPRLKIPNVTSWDATQTWNG